MYMSAKYIKCDGVIVREEDDEALLFEHGEHGNAKISLLNKTGYVIWNLCDGDNSIEDIINLFSVRFPNIRVKTIETDVAGFINRMMARGWLKILPVR